MTVTPQSEVFIRADELAAFISRQAVHEGPTHSIWPGLTFYRFEQPVMPYWEEVGSTLLCVVAQGRKRVRIGVIDYFYDPFHFSVMTRGLRFQVEILQASPEHPFLSFILQVQPNLVIGVCDEMNCLVPELFRIEPASPTAVAFVTVLDQHLVSTVQRFLLALESESERKVLAPMYLREIVYRLLRSEQRVRLLESAARETHGNAITTVIAFMKQEMQRPLPVRDLAAVVSMSESGFAHLFKATTGVSPLQFLKQLRLEQARKFLLNGANVSEAAESIGYTSLSHFISEFRRHFGEPPSAYAQRLRDLHAVAIRDTSRV